MAVDVGRVNEILAQFNERVQSVISANGLDHYKGTASMNSIQAVSERFTTMVHENFTKEESTEGMIYSARDDAIADIENIARNMVSKENFYLQGLAGQSVPADSQVWNKKGNL